MRFMTLIKSAENLKIGPPSAELFQAIGRLGGEAAQAGVLVDTAGLMPTAVGARIRLEGGKMTTSEEPIAGVMRLLEPTRSSTSSRSRTPLNGRSDSWKCTKSIGKVGRARPRCAR
jgi:hypothetical protein